MSFDLTGWGRVSSSGNEASIIQYTYRNTSDTLATIKGSGYFNSLIPDLTNGAGVLNLNDVIMIQGSDGYDLVTVTAVTTAVTVGEFGNMDVADGSITAAKLASNAVTTVKITDANVTLAKLENVTSGQVIVGNGSNRPTAVAMSGDVAIDNAGATTIQAGAVESSMLAVPKIRGAVRHTWAGGVATTDTVTLTGVAATDVIHVTANTQALTNSVVKAERSGVDSILVTMSGNMANGEILSVTAIQVV